MQYNLEMQPTTLVRPKKGSRARLYKFPPEVIVMVDYLAMISGRPKPEVVADAIRISTILQKYVPRQELDKVLEEKSVEPLMKALERILGEAGT